MHITLKLTLKQRIKVLFGGRITADITPFPIPEPDKFLCKLTGRLNGWLLASQNIAIPHNPEAWEKEAAEKLRLDEWIRQAGFDPTFFRKEMRNRIK